MPAKIKCAVIGTGNMGKNHVRTYAELPMAELVAIADLDENIGQSLADQYGVKYYKSYQKMLEKEKPTAVSICVPTSLHFEVARNCIKNDINILLEKPIAMKEQEAKKILALAKNKKIKILIGHIERHNPAVKKVKQMIKQGQLGKIIAVIARRVGGFPPQIKDADIAVDLAIHDIDIVNFLLESLPDSVKVNKGRNHIKNRDDAVEFFLQYKNASAYVQANWITPVKIRKLTITGTEGYLEMDYINQQIDFYKSNYEKFLESSGDFSDYILKFSEPDKLNISVTKKEPLKEEIIYFLNCIKKNQNIDCQFALDALRIALQ